jgi:hypothetical protein
MKLVRYDDWVVVEHDPEPSKQDPGTWWVYEMGPGDEAGHRWKSLDAWSLGHVLFTATGEPLFTMPPHMPRNVAQFLTEELRNW